MTSWMVAGVSVLGAGWVVARVRAVLRRDRARDRLEAAPSATTSGREQLRRVGWRRAAVRLRLAVVPLVVGLAAALGAILFAGLSPGLGVSLGLLLAMIAGILDGHLRRRGVVRVENQLAESLDLVVSALAAGAGPTEALDVAAREAPRPVHGHLMLLTERLRLGEGPEAAFLALEQSLPLESVRMLRLALSAHWEGGGSMGRTIAAVARTTRDRVALMRRIQGQSAEAQASVLGVIVVTYLLAALMWTMDPARVSGFLESGIGSWATPAAVLLQVLGLFWMMRLTEVEA